MPQLFGSMINAAIINSALWYYLLGKFPFQLMLTYKMKFLISYQLAFFVMAWIWYAIQLFRNTNTNFLDCLINGVKLPLLNAVLMSIPIIGIYVLLNIWFDGGWAYRLKYIAAVVLCGTLLWFIMYGVLSDVYQEDLNEPASLHIFLVKTLWSIGFSLLWFPYAILKGIFYDLPFACWNRKFEIITLIALLGGAVWAVDYLMLKGKLWKNSVAYVKDLGNEASEIFTEDTDNKKKIK